MRGLVFLIGLFFLTVRISSQADEFAQDRFPAPDPPVAPVKFDGEQAMKHLKEICKLGPRISGSPQMEKQQELLLGHFRLLGAIAIEQTFQARQTSRVNPVTMTNLIFQWHPERRRRVILCCHYDTRPIADQEPNRGNWKKPFVSANDGGSGIALLMELANHLEKLEVKVGIDFVFFDGEEYIFEPKRDRYFLGSEHFAKTYRQRKTKDHVYVAAILLDMIGGKNAKFPIEQNSWWWAAPLVKEVWTIAQQQRCTAFQGNRFSRVAVRDDHLALNRAGIPAIDIIDFDYRHWHRLSDVPENCSADSLSQVGRVLLVWLQKVR